ncbi:MAG: hypothetical protein V1766_04175 [Pseudomonadota bacterium]
MKLPFRYAFFVLALSATAFFSLVSATEATDRRVRTGVNALSPAEVNRLAQFYQDKQSRGLYERDQDFQRQVYQQAGRQADQNIRDSRNVVENFSNQQLQSAFLRTMQQVNRALTTAGENPISTYANYGGETVTQLDSQIRRWDAAAARGEPGAAERKNQYEILKNGAQALHMMTQTIQDYGNISDKMEAAQRGGTAAQVDVSADVMKNFLSSVSTYVGVIKERQEGQLSQLAPLGQPIPGLTGPGGEKKIEAILGLERNVQQLQNAGYYANQATQVIDKANTIVRSLDAAINNPDYERIQRNEYLTGEQKDFAQVSIGTGKGLQEIASLIPGVPGEIVKMGGQGIELIGRSAQLGAALEERKLQGGMGGIDSEFRGALEDFRGAALVVRQDGSTGELFIPDGTGRGQVQIASDKLDQLQDAVSAFSSLTGRNPTQEELATLAGGGSVDVEGSRMNVGMLSDPFRRTDFDLRGAERAQLDQFVSTATAGVEDKNLQRWNEDGIKGPMTREDHRDRLEELNRLSQELYGQNVSPNIYGADLQSGGAIKQRMEEEKKKREEEAQAAEQRAVQAEIKRQQDEKEHQKEEEERKRAEEEDRLRKEDEERQRAEQNRKNQEESDQQETTGAGPASEGDQDSNRWPADYITAQIIDKFGGIQDAEERKNAIADYLQNLRDAERGSGGANASPPVKPGAGSDADLQSALNTNVSGSFQQDLDLQRQQEAQQALGSIGSTQAERAAAAQNQQMQDQSQVQAQGQQTTQAINTSAQEFSTSQQNLQVERQNSLGNILLGSFMGGLTSGVATGIDQFAGGIGRGAGQQVSANWGIQPPPPPPTTGSGSSGSQMDTGQAGSNPQTPPPTTGTPPAPTQTASTTSGGSSTTTSRPPTTTPTTGGGGFCRSAGICKSTRYLDKKSGCCTACGRKVVQIQTSSTTQIQKPPVRSTTTTTAPTRRCQQVCVQKKVEWKNVSDGRHGLCAGGVPRPPGPGLRPPKCVRNEICTKWETRCQSIIIK